MNKKNNKIILAFVGLCAVLMLASALAHRFTNPSLVKDNPVQQQSQVPSQMAGGQPNELAMLMQKIQTNPQDKDALLALAEQFLQMQDPTAAANFASQLINLEPNHFEGLYILGISLHQQGKYDEARNTLEQALSIKEDVTLLFSLGVLYSHFLNDKVKAKTYFERALKANNLPDDLKTAIEEELGKI